MNGANIMTKNDVLVAVIIQARTSSSRFPQKVLKDIFGRTLIEFLIERLKRSKKINDYILATTKDFADQSLVSIGNKLGLIVYRGSKNDVLSRYAEASNLTNANVIVRITGDCPLIDPEIIDETIECFFDQKVDYLSNCNPPTYPDGLDVEVFTKDALLQANKECLNRAQREHVTPWIRDSNQYKIGVKVNNIDLSNYRWTVDEPEDLIVIKSIVREFGGSSTFTWKDVLSLHESKSEIFLPNSAFRRNEGSLMNEGQKLWRRAKRVIPGGNMLLSKRAEMFLPDKWPAYFSSSKGCQVWDLSGNKYFDMSIMSIGTNTLGYGNEEVDKAVADVISAGNMSTLNCPEEVYLSEKLVEIHPWAEMVRLARSGGEANAIAIRIARAATGKEKIAICGYHGWHDWYLATNLGDKQALNEHLLPGLDPNGVPNSLSGTVIPFSFNNIDQVKDIVSRHDLAAIKMEVERSVPPKEGFLETIREICTKKGIVLIFDECTSGFRETFGGIHKKYKISPDLAMFGKALGNGYAITAVIGKRNVMEAAQSTFISSTFWTERIGPVAALKTLEVMHQQQSWVQITKTGRQIKGIWNELANKYSLKIEHYGIPSLAGFNFKYRNHLKYKTLLTQEMLKEGFLASTICYSCISHSNEILDLYSEKLDNVFSLVSRCEDGFDIDNLLESSVCHKGFSRLN